MTPTPPTPTPTRSPASGLDAVAIPDSPASWWRHPCFAHSRLIVTGDLPQHETGARQLLATWIELGVTHIVDVRGEWSDAELVAEVAPHIAYIWAGTNDAGTSRDDSWFDYVLTSLGDALSDPDAVILVHCHMGINRGPSLAVRLLLEQGYSVVGALEAIRSARPIAGLIYAVDAVDHYCRSAGYSRAAREAQTDAARAWLQANPIDVSWVISRIRRVEN